MKAGGGAKRNASIKQGTQVSTATTTRHRHTDKLSGDTTYQPVYLPWPTKREGRGGTNCCTNAQIQAQNSTSRASTRHLTLSEDPYVG